MIYVLYAVVCWGMSVLFVGCVSVLAVMGVSVLFVGSVSVLALGDNLITEKHPNTNSNTFQ